MQKTPAPKGQKTGQGNAPVVYSTMAGHEYGEVPANAYAAKGNAPVGMIYKSVNRDVQFRIEPVMSSASTSLRTSAPLQDQGIRRRFHVYRIQNSNGLREDKMIGWNLSHPNAFALVKACRQVEAILTKEGK